MRPKSKAKEFKGTVKEVLGAWYFLSTAECSQSVGGLVEGKAPKEVCKLIDKGELEIKEP